MSSGVYLCHDTCVYMTINTEKGMGDTTKHVERRALRFYIMTCVYMTLNTDKRMGDTSQHV